MITNSSLTLYHKDFDENTKKETWTRYNYKDIWWFSVESANNNDGYDDNNSVNIRIPYATNTIDINNIAKGDILVNGTLNTNITTQQDLSNYTIYHVTSISNNKFGNNPHVHLGGQ